MGSSSDFEWGFTTSSLAAEGAAPRADWAAWEAAGHAPRSSDGSGFASDYADDLELLASLGAQSVRLNLDWSRLEPWPRQVDNDAVDYYRGVLQAARDAGLAVWATLHHTTAPGWFVDDERGFVDASSRSNFWARHVDRTAEQFDDLVGGWVPMEDPIGGALRGWLLGTRPPGRRDPDAARDAVVASLEANFDAWKLLRSGDQPVMTVVGLPTVHAARPEAREERGLWEHVLWRSWARVISDGWIDVPWRGPVVDEALIDAFDIIGIAYDHPIAVDVDSSFGPYPATARTDASGFAPNAEELGVVLRRVAELVPDKPLLVASNGVTTADDDWRDELLRATAGQIDLARADGVSVIGYHHDTGIDGYHESRGFAGQRGLITRDRELKPSARTYRELATRP